MIYMFYVSQNALYTKIKGIHRKAIADCKWTKKKTNVIDFSHPLHSSDTGSRKRTSTTTPPTIQRSQEVVPVIPSRSSESSQRASSLNSISSSEGSS